MKFLFLIVFAALSVSSAYSRDNLQGSGSMNPQDNSQQVSQQSGRQACSSKKTGIVAHRGFWNCQEAGFAKNSIAALKCAQDAGFWGSEFDVNMTSDEVLLVYHDNKIDGKVIDKNPYETFRDVKLKNGEKIPTLDEYLVQAKKHSGTVLVFEFKARSTKELEDRMVDLSIERLKKHGLLSTKKVIFISFSINICEKIARELPKFTVQYLGNDFSPEELAAKGINGIDFHHTLFALHPKWYGQARENGMSVNAWTVNKEADMKRMLEMGADFITTDNPLQLRELIKSDNRKELK